MMNKTQIKAIVKARNQLEVIKATLEDINAETQEKYEEMNETQQESDKGVLIQEQMDNLEGTNASLEEAIGFLGDFNVNE